MSMADAATVFHVAVVLDDPETVVSTEDLFAVVRADGEVAVGPPSSIGDVAEWVFDAEADSFEAAYDLVARAVLRQFGAERSMPVDLPERVQVFVWPAGEPIPDRLAVWDAARRPNRRPRRPAAGHLGRCACGALATRQAPLLDRVYCAACDWRVEV